MDSHIGAQCEVCQLRDYLPLRCATCSRFFCRGHIQQHECLAESAKPASEAPFLLCGFCEKIQIAACAKCGRPFCVAHRVHPCTVEEEKSVSRPAPVARPKHKMPEKPKNPELADKLQRMLVRRRATGDEGIPEESRVALHFECAADGFPLDIFVAAYQALGVAVDVAARRTRLDSRGVRATTKSGSALDLNATVAPQLQPGDTIVLLRS